jgi:Uri superfamily endonuclease
VISHAPEPLPGTYILVCQARQAGFVPAGGLGRLSVPQGYFLYVGSALGPGGLRARLAHHMRPVLKPHWHIDYLRTVAHLRQIWFCYGQERREHDWAGVLHQLRGASIPFPGFGSSDCGCASHLFFFEKCPTQSAFAAALREAGHHPTRIDRFDPESRTLTACR